MVLVSIPYLAESILFNFQQLQQQLDTTGYFNKQHVGSDTVDSSLAEASHEGQQEHHHQEQSYQQQQPQQDPSQGDYNQQQQQQQQHQWSNYHGQWQQDQQGQY